MESYIILSIFPLISCREAHVGRNRRYSAAWLVYHRRNIRLRYCALAIGFLHFPTLETNSLSTRFLSMSTTSMRRPSHSNQSEAVGMRPTCIITKPPTV